MSFDELNPDNLLAFVEGKLDPPDADAVLARVAREPRLAVMLEQMRAQRAILRNEPEPVLPADFLAEIEPVLARPMLIPPADEVRRRYQRRNATPFPWRRLGLLAAAGFAVVAGVGIWIANLSSAPGSRETVTPGFGGLVAAPDASLPAGTLTDPSPLPQPGEITQPDGLQPMSPEPPTRMAVRTPPAAGPSTASFALVLYAADEASAEALLEQTLKELETMAALVRNLDDEEVAALTEQWHRDRARRGLPREAVAGADDANPPGTPRRRPAPRIDRSVLRSRQLFGPRTLELDFETQLALSRNGATHTIAIPAGRLAQLLEHLQVDHDAATTLRLLSGSDGEPWGQYRTIREAAAGLLATPEAVVWLPVEVRSGAR